MRGSVAKRLRKMAAERTIGKPDCEHGLVTHHNGARQLKVKLTSTRGMYLNFKKWYKKGKLC